MPFNGSGTFSIINTFVPNTTILSSAVNANFTDIATGLSDCLTRDGQAGMSAAFKAIAGSAASPSITFTSDTTTGLYLVGAAQLGLSSGGVLALTLDAAQIGQFAQSIVAKVHMTLNTAAASTSSNINSLATSGTGAIAIGTSTNWATNGYLLCGNEVMSYTVASANGLTINTRGDMGTTAISHATASTITSLYSALGYRDLLLPARSTANRPAGPAPGDIGYNSGSTTPEYWNGTAWASFAAPNITPQIYVSPSASVTFITADTTATNLYVYPNGGNLLPVPTAGVYSLQTLTTVATAAMTAGAQVGSGIYDLYAFVSGGALTFGFSPSWSAGTSGSVTAGSCARGTGTGGTVLTTAGGFYVNGVAMTLNNGATTYSIATASGIYLYSVVINSATAGAASFTRSYGQNRQWPGFNTFNRVPIYMKGGDGTATWTYATTTVRPSNNSTANSLVVFAGLAEEMFDLKIQQNVSSNTAGTNPVVQIGWNSTTAGSGLKPSPVLAGGTTVFGNYPGEFLQIPSLGINIVTALESGTNGSTTFEGTETNMMLSARYRA